MIRVKVSNSHARNEVTMKIESSVFKHNARIPPRYTCEGENLSPPLSFSSVPSEAVSLVLVMDDPDAPGGTFDHWVLWNLPPQLLSVTEGAPELAGLTPPASFPEGKAVFIGQGVNGYGKRGYKGPCPPPGKIHRYFFRLYALDCWLSLPKGVDKSDVQKVLQGHLLEEALLIGTYSRDS